MIGVQKLERIFQSKNSKYLLFLKKIYVVVIKKVLTMYEDNEI